MGGRKRQVSWWLPAIRFLSLLVFFWCLVVVSIGGVFILGFFFPFLASWLFGFLAFWLLGFLACWLFGFSASRLLGFWASGLLGFLLVYVFFFALAFRILCIPSSSSAGGGLAFAFMRLLAALAFRILCFHSSSLGFLAFAPFCTLSLVFGFGFPQPCGYPNLD